MPQDHFEICVIGGGPAGSVAAAHLAKLGHRVCLVERCAFPRPHVGESLTIGIWPILDALGLREQALQQGFFDAGETLVRWAEPTTERLLPEQRGAGLLVDRGRFDALLLHAAVDASVRIFQPATVRTVSRQPSGWCIDISTQVGAALIRADFLVDATGRNGFLPGRRKQMSPPTVALSGYVRASDGARPTLVEARPAGWIWGAPIPGGCFNAIVFLDPATLRTVRREGLERLWRSFLAQAELFSDFAQAPLARPVVAHDATAYAAAQPIGSNFARIGEASFSLDPLSSTGVEKAMQSGSIAAIALHTIAISPDRTGLCASFYRGRQLETVTSHARWSSDFYCQVKRYAEFPFWRARSALASDRPKPDVAVAPSRPVGCAEVRISEHARWIEEPCIVEDQIRGQMALIHPSLDRPVAFLGGVNVGKLLETAVENQDLTRLMLLWSNWMPLHQARSVGAWLIARRILEYCNGRGEEESVGQELSKPFTGSG